MIDKLEMFIALAQEQHFGRAAEDRGVTQPTLSAGIRSLEDQLGVQLVWRGSRFQGLTPEGQRVLEWARRIVADSRAMKEEMRAAKRGLAGDLRLAAIPTALSTVAQITTPFQAHHPNVRFSTLSRSSIDILTLLENLEIDAGITYLDNEPLGRVTTVPLYAERYVLICRGDAAVAERPAIPWAEAAALPLGLLTPDMQNRRIINQTFAAAGVTAAAAIEANSVLVLISHVLEAGLATILPLKTAEIFLAGGALAAIPLTDPDPRHVVGLVALHREPHTPVLEALLREARAVAELG
jgi:DNA-binding transcriptional LysR family regulator